MRRAHVSEPQPSRRSTSVAPEHCVFSGSAASPLTSAFSAAGSCRDESPHTLWLRRRGCPKKVVLCLATFICAGGSLSVRQANADGSTGGVRSTGLISDRRQVPADPLAGLPDEDTDQSKGRRGHERAQTAGGKSACRLEVGPESEREVGDLRAAVAVIQRGLRTTPCTSGQMANPLRLRLSIDSEGRITLVERLSGDQKLGDELARKLVGQVSQSKVTSSTTGVTHIHFTRTAR